MTQPLDTPIEIDDLGEFIELLTVWHNRRVAQLEQLLDIPDGTSASLEDGEEVVLTGEALVAFKIGINASLSHLGVLPFITQQDDAPEVVGE